MKKQTLIDLALFSALIVGFGAFAVFLGQDANWDTRNYHVYNPYAALTDRLDLDLAPAQMQTYFSPVIDMPVYWLNQFVSPWIIGFLLGGFQGLNAILIFLIARTVLSTHGKPALLAPMLLALLGCLNASFVAQLGASAGDSTSAVFVLAALYLLVRRTSALGTQEVTVPPPAGSIGLLLGLAVGLKLTNAPFAVAMAMTLALVPDSTSVRLRNVLRYSVGAIANLALTSGWWFYEVWVKFGNPLFPQFNGLFHSALATDTSVIDKRWGPVNIGEVLAWPLWMSLRPTRIHDAPLYNYLWACAFMLLLLWLTREVLRIFHNEKSKEVTTFTLVLIFSCVSYLVWLKIFSIGRYMTVVEVMLPLFIYKGIRAFTKHRLALVGTLMTAVWSLSIGLIHSNFGQRAAWGDQSYSVDVPPIASPATATVLIASSGEPISWILSQFPPEVSILRVSGNFPRTLAYDERIRSTIAARGGKVYVIAQPALNFSAMRLLQLNQQLAAYPLTDKPFICEAVGLVTAQLTRYGSFQIYNDASGACRAELVNQSPTPAHDVNDDLTAANESLAMIGYSLVLGSCGRHSAFIGHWDFPYQFCDAKLRVKVE